MTDSKRAELEALRAETETALEPTLTEAQTQVVFGTGNPQAAMMIVGEAPGPQEDRIGEPFVGPSGEVMNDVLAELGIRRESLWISNVVKIWPTRRDGDSLRTRPPYAAERRASRPFFEREVALISPDVMVLVGGTAAKEILGTSFKITEQRGEWFSGLYDIPTIATYHPSYILRMGGPTSKRGAQILRDFKADLKRAAARAGTRDA